MSQLTRDYKGTGRRNLRSAGMKEFALGVLAGALLSGGIAALIAAHARHLRALACTTAAGSAQAPGNAAGAESGAATAGARSTAATPSGAAAGKSAAGTAAPAAGHASALPAQHYDFYRMLPRLTVPVPAKSSAAHARRPARPAASPSYLLQVGSYSSDAQARQVLERLTRMGLAAQIQRATEHGRTLERVRVGPVDSAGLAHIRRELAAAGFHPLVIPTRHE